MIYDEGEGDGDNHGKEEEEDGEEDREEDGCGDGAGGSAGDGGNGKEDTTMVTLRRMSKMRMMTIIPTKMTMKITTMIALAITI